MKWTKEVVEYLENNCFHQNGKVLVRESDMVYQGKIDDLIKNHLRDKSEDGSIKVLDFGCGTGRQLELNNYSYENNEYIGHDKSKEMIEKAKEKFPNNQFSDLDPFALNPDMIDLLISNDVLQHTKNLDEFTNIITEMLLISNNVICHCWYEGQEKYQKISLAGEFFDEFFVDPVKLENYFNEVLKEYDFDIMKFPNQKPYKCLVFSLSLKEKEVKEIEKTPISSDQIDQIIEDQE